MILFAPNLGMYDACRFNVYPPSVLHTAPPLTAATRRHARTHNHTHVRANVLQHNLGTNPGRVACRAQARAVIPENMRPRLSSLVSVIGHVAFP